MADVPGGAAAALYPNLPSAAPPEAVSKAAQPPPAAERSAAETIYGFEPKDGIEKAREGIAAGIARPAAETTEAVPELSPKGEAGEFGLAPGPLADKFSGLAREAGLSQASASKMVELHQEALTSASTEFWAKTGADWEKSSRTQFGARLPAMVEAVAPLLGDKRLTTPGFVHLLNHYRLGNNPDFVQTLANWARAIASGRRR